MSKNLKEVPEQTTRLSGETEAKEIPFVKALRQWHAWPTLRRGPCVWSRVRGKEDMEI